MRAREFTINVPIKITINGDNDPEISVDDEEVNADDKAPMFMSPQQQEIELEKSDRGKRSAGISQLVDDPDNEESFQADLPEIGDPRHRFKKEVKDG